jgi:hypothetical protein
MLTSLVRFTAISLLLACNGKLDTSPEEGPRILRGTAVQHHRTDNGIVDQPRDLGSDIPGSPTSALRPRSGGDRRSGRQLPGVARGGAVEWLEIGWAATACSFPAAPRPGSSASIALPGDIQLPA